MTDHAKTEQDKLDSIILEAWEKRPLMECSHDENSHFAGYLASFDRADYTMDFECLLESERDAVREYTEGVLAAIEPHIVERERRAKVELLEEMVTKAMLDPDLVAVPEWLEDAHEALTPDEAKQ